MKAAATWAHLGSLMQQGCPQQGGSPSCSWEPPQLGSALHWADVQSFGAGAHLLPFAASLGSLLCSLHTGPSAGAAKRRARFGWDGVGSILPLFAVPYTLVLLLLEMGHWVHGAFVQPSPAQYETTPASSLGRSLHGSPDIIFWLIFRKAVGRRTDQDKNVKKLGSRENERPEIKGQELQAPLIQPLAGRSLGWAGCHRSKP